MNRRVVNCVAVLLIALGGAIRADEPDKKPVRNSTATTRPLEPGDVGQTTVTRSAKDGPLPVAVRWWGHACISIETFWNLTVVIDPFPAGKNDGDPKPSLTADLVLITHEAPHHNAADVIGGKPVVLHGVTADGKDWEKIDHVLDRPANEPAASVYPRSDARKLSSNAVFMRGIGVHSKADATAERPRNAMFLIETCGVRILHCGDLGGTLSKEQLADLGEIDVLIVPVGGEDTLNATGAMEVIRQVKPKSLIWPLHFSPDAVAVPADATDAFVEEARRADLLTRDVDGNTAAVSALPPGMPPPVGSPVVVMASWKPCTPVPRISRMLLSLRDDRQTLIDSLGKVTNEQLYHRPSDGSHTISWNFEHTTARELGLFSQIYNALDPAIPVINWNPEQMPKDYAPRHPEWGPEEIVRHVKRIGAFTERFSYLLNDAPPTMRIEGTRFSLEYLTAMIVGHYQNHTSKAVHKFTLPDWPRR